MTMDAIELGLAADNLQLPDSTVTIAMAQAC
jgi:hypothetical protein